MGITWATDLCLSRSKPFRNRGKIFHASGQVLRQNRSHVGLIWTANQSRFGRRFDVAERGPVRSFTPRFNPTVYGLSYWLRHEVSTKIGQSFPCVLSMWNDIYISSLSISITSTTKISKSNNKALGHTQASKFGQGCSNTPTQHN